MDPKKSRAVIRIVDDDKGVRESYKYLIEGEGWLVRTYESAEAFLEKDDPTIQGCGVFDVRMPGLSGIELQAHLEKMSSNLPIIFVSAHGDVETAVKALKHGAIDFLCKPIVDETLLEAIDRAVEKSFSDGQREMENSQLIARWERLSQREKEVAVLVDKGLMNKVIAQDLGISERTVQVHRANLCQKLGVRNAVGISKCMQQLRSLGLNVSSFKKIEA